jgi:hypothetical protein
MLGLGLLAAGALVWIVFALPSFVFPEEKEKRFRPVVPPPVRSDDLSLIYARMTQSFRTSTSGVVAPVAPVAVRTPSSTVTTAFRESPHSSPIAAPEIRVAAAPSPRAAAPMIAEPPLPPAPPDPVRAPDVPPSQIRSFLDDARGERFQFVSEEASNILKRAEDDRRRADEARRAEASRRERRQARLVRRLERWRAAWRERLSQREAALRAETHRVEASRAEVSSRWEKERARLAAERATLSDARGRLEGDRAASAASRAEAEASLRRMESEILQWESKIQELTQAVTSLETLRRDEARTGAVDMERIRKDAREEGRAWREHRRALEASVAAEMAEKERTLSVVMENAQRETESLRRLLADESASFARDKADLEAQARVIAEEAMRQTRELQERLAARRTMAEKIDALHRASREALQRERDAFAREIATLRSWAEGRMTTLREASAKAQQAARTALEALAAKKAGIEAALSEEKRMLRRDVDQYRAKADEDRAARAKLLSDARRAHQERLEAMRLEESSLEARIAALTREVDAYKEATLKAEAKAKERILRRKVAHEKVYVAARAAGDEKLRLAALDEQSVGASVSFLERRLEVRRRRFALLRDRRRQAFQGVVARAQATLDEALSAQARIEAAAKAQLTATSARKQEWTDFRGRMSGLAASVPGEEAKAVEAFKEAAAREMTDLSATVSQRWKELNEATRRGRDAMPTLASHLSAADRALSAEETDFQSALSAVRDQAVFLDRLRVFFRSLRPAVTSDVVPDETVNS